VTTIITTLSGTQYVVRDGATVTRYGREAVVGYDRHIAGDRLVAMGEPVVGAAWRFRTEAGPFVSTAVTAVTVR